MAHHASVSLQILYHLLSVCLLNFFSRTNYCDSHADKRPRFLSLCSFLACFKIHCINSFVSESKLDTLCDKQMSLVMNLMVLSIVIILRLLIFAVVQTTLAYC
jgi:hypothetical protein